MKYCIEKDPDRTVMPKKDTFINFKNCNRKMCVSAVIYADFECYLNNTDTCQPNALKPYTNAYKRHTPSGFYYRVVYTHKETKEGLLYCGEDVAKRFVECMEEEMRDIADMYQDEKDMVMTKEDNACFKASTRCHICDDELGMDKVRDHDHLTRKFCGA